NGRTEIFYPDTTGKYVFIGAQWTRFFTKKAGDAMTKPKTETKTKALVRTPKELVPLIQKLITNADKLEVDARRQHKAAEAAYDAAVGDEMDAQVTAAGWRAEAGRLMLEAKDSPAMKHGEFKPWLAKNFTTISYRTATNYMRLAETENPDWAKL